MIHLEKEDGVWVVTLDRPEKANALTPDMLTQLCEIVESADQARCLVLTGTGKVFSAGADLDAAKAGLATSPLWERLSGGLAGLEALTICAMNGTAAGGAMGMVLASDLRIATPGARFFYPVMKLGYLPQPSDPGRLARLVGPSRAKMILVAGAKVGASDALAWGLLDRIVEGDLMEEARALCADVLSASPQHAAAIKGMIP